MDRGEATLTCLPLHRVGLVGDHPFLVTRPLNEKQSPRFLHRIDRVNRRSYDEVHVIIQVIAGHRTLPLITTMTSKRVINDDQIAGRLFILPIPVHPLIISHHYQVESYLHVHSWHDDHLHPQQRRLPSVAVIFSSPGKIGLRMKARSIRRCSSERERMSVCRSLPR